MPSEVTVPDFTETVTEVATEPEDRDASDLLIEDTVEFDTEIVDSEMTEPELVTSPDDCDTVDVLVDSELDTVVWPDADDTVDEMWF